MESQTVQANATGTLAGLLLRATTSPEDNESAWTKNLSITVYKKGKVAISVGENYHSNAQIETTLADLMACMTALKGKAV